MCRAPEGWIPDRMRMVRGTRLAGSWRKVLAGRWSGRRGHRRSAPRSPDVATVPTDAGTGQAGVTVRIGALGPRSRPGLAGQQADATINAEPTIGGPWANSEAEEDPVTTRIYEGHGVRFAYPSEWQLEESDEDKAATVEVQAPGGLAFALVRSDETGPDPASVADEVLDAMREEYPDLEVAPAMETIAGHHATGYDVEFFSLDITNGAS